MLGFALMGLKSDGGYRQLIDQTGFTAGLPWRGITGRYIRDCIDGRADPAQLRATLAKYSSANFVWAIAIKDEPFVFGAGPPRGSLIQDATIGFPLTWASDERRTGYLDVFDRADPFLDGSRMAAAEYWDRWCWTWYDMNWLSVEDGSTYLYRQIEFLQFALYLTVIIFTVTAACRARRAGSRRKALLFASAALATTIGAAFPRTSTFESNDFGDSGGVPFVIARDMPRMWIAENLKTDEGVREIAARICRNADGYIEDDWVIRGSFDTHIAATYDQSSWQCWNVLHAGRTEVFAATKDAEPGECEPSTSLQWHRYGPMLTVHRDQQKHQVMIFWPPIAAVMLLTIILGATTTQILHLAAARKKRRRELESRCIACGYPLPAASAPATAHAASAA